MGALKWPFLCHMGCLPVLTAFQFSVSTCSVTIRECFQFYSVTVTEYIPNFCSPPSQTQKTSDLTTRWAENWLWTLAISLSYSSKGLTKTFLEDEGAIMHVSASCRSCVHLLKRFRLFASSSLNSQPDIEWINAFNCHRQSWIDGKSENNEQMRCWNA